MDHQHEVGRVLLVGRRRGDGERAVAVVAHDEARRRGVDEADAAAVVLFRLEVHRGHGVEAARGDLARRRAVLPLEASAEPSRASGRPGGESRDGRWGRPAGEQRHVCAAGVLAERADPDGVAAARRLRDLDGRLQAVGVVVAGPRAVGTGHGERGVEVGAGGDAEVAPPRATRRRRPALRGRRSPGSRPSQFRRRPGR